MIGFESYHHIIDFANNPNYDFISYNTNPDILIYADGFKKPIKEEYEYENIMLVNGWTKRDKNSIHFYVSQSMILLSFLITIYALLGLIRYFFFSDFVFNNDSLWFFVFGFAFLVPLLLGFYRLFNAIISFNKHYKELNYQAFVLSNRMLSDSRIATSNEISDAIDELTIYFENNYYSFEDRKHIKRFFEKRCQRISLTYYNNFKKQSVKFSFESHDSNSIAGIVAELLIGVIGTILNIVKDYSIVGPALQQIIVMTIVLILLTISLAYLFHCLKVYRMREVFYYYYIYSYLFLDSTTDKKVAASYLFNFSLKNNDNELSIFKDSIFNIIHQNKIPVFRKDIEIICEDDKTKVIFYGVDNYDKSLNESTKFTSFDEFLNHVTQKVLK